MAHRQHPGTVYASSVGSAVLLAGCISMFAASAHASTFGRIEEVCPFDRTKVQAMVPMSGTSFGSTFDLQPVGPIVTPYPYLVCPDGFIFYKDGFSEDELKQIKPLLSSREFRKLATESVHYRVAWLQERIGGQAQDIAYNLLQASWEAKSSDDYTRQASRLLAALGPAISAEKNPKIILRLQLLKGEVLRRLSRFDEARTHFGQLADVLGSGSDEATIVQLELAMVAAHDANARTVPRKALDEARSSGAWLVARQPVLPTNTVLGTVTRQLRTSGGRGFLWSRDSRYIHAEMDPRYGTTILERSSLIDDKTTSKMEINIGYTRLVATLPNGNILASNDPPSVTNGSAKPSEAAAARGARLIELESATAKVVHSVPAPTLYNKPAFISFDGTLALLDAAPVEFAAYSIPNQAAASIPGGTQKDDRAWDLLALDPNAPRLAALARKEVHLPPEAIVVWNWEQKRRDISIPQSALDSQFRISGLIFNPGTNEIALAREQLWGGRKCELQFYDLATGRLQWSREGDGQSTSIARSPDGRYLAYGCDGKLELLDAADPSRIVETISAPRDLKFTGMRFSPDSRFIAIEIDNVVTVFAVKQ